MGRFSELTGGFKRSASELVHEEESRFDPRSVDDMANEPFIVNRQDFDRQRAPSDDMRKYWRQYESTPIIRKPINAFANRVIEPGYFIDAPQDTDKEVVRDLEHWLETAAIVETETQRDIRDLIKGAIIQREVRGTAIIEKVYAEEDRDSLMALKPLHPETVEVNTKPGQAILLDPDDHQKEDWEPPLTPEGKAAAYLQNLNETDVIWGSSKRLANSPDNDRYPNRIGFTKDDILKVSRDNDIGEPFGTSRIESVSDRVEGLKNKLCDNDQAIQSKAYPLWLFKFGTDEKPWKRTDIDNFMTEHEMSNFHPGMKQGVRGDVTVETVSGEVADIAESLHFDMNWIIFAMPMLSQFLGAVPSEFTGGAQATPQMERNIIRQIKDLRRELETKFTEALRERAVTEGMSEDEAREIYFRIGNPLEQEENPPNVQEIRYRGVGNDQRQNNVPPQDQPQEQPQVQRSSPSESPQDGQRNTPEDQSTQQVTSNESHEYRTSAELAEDRESRLEQLVEDVFLRARDKSIERAEKEYRKSRTGAPQVFPRLSTTVIGNAIKGRRLHNKVKTILQEEFKSVEELPDHSIAHKRESDVFADDVILSVKNALDEIMEEIRIQLKRGSNDGESFGVVKGRVETKYDDSRLKNRSSMIASMSLKDAVETMKLRQFERDDDVVGVRVHNPDATSPVSEAAHGTEAFFEEGDIGEQIREQVPEKLYREGFDPLPVTPPYHFGDETVLKPITRE